MSNQEKQIEELVRQVDEARARDDQERIKEIEAEIREIKGGKPRQLSGVANIRIPIPKGKGS